MPDTPKKESASPENSDRRSRHVEEYRRVADRLIEEAMARGEFDDIPGKGQPLDLRQTDADRQGTWAVQRILDNNDFKPDWIADRQEIERRLEDARRALTRAWEWRQAALARGEGYAFVAAQWDAAVARFAEAVDEINKRIRAYNLKAPHARLHLRVINPQREIAVVQQRSS